MWLFDIIKDGTLVDNHSYLVNQGILTNGRLSNSVTLSSKSKGQRKCPRNNESAIWHFLNSVSRDVEKTLNDNISDALILFNDEDYEHNTDGGFIGVTGTDARNFTPVSRQVRNFSLENHKKFLLFQAASNNICCCSVND